MRERTARGIVFQIVAEHLHALVAGVAERHVAATCGVSSRFFARRSGWSAGSGSGTTTSSAAAGELPALSASQSASWSMAVPRADVHDEGAVGQQRDALAREDAHGLRRGGQRHDKDIRFGQDAVQLRDGMDGGERRVGGSDRAAHAGDARGWKACARRANSVPMSPMPSTVMRAPCSERIPPGSVSQPPARMISVYSIWRRSSIRQTMMRCSEMVVP